MIKIIEDYDSRFRKYEIAFHFFIPKTAKQAIYAGALANALEMGTRQYPSVTAWNEACSSLYGASIHAETRMYREMIDVIVSFGGCSDDVLGCDNFKDVTALFKEFMMHPLFLEADNTRVIKQVNLIRLQNIESIKDNPSDYCLLMAGKKAYQDTDYALDALGSLDIVKRIIKKNLIDLYQELLHHSYVIVTAKGHYPTQECYEFIDKFINDCGIESQEKPDYSMFYLLNQDPINSYGEFHESFPINQCSINQIYRTQCLKTPKNIALFNVLTEYLTGQTDSVLFQKIREKMGICYRIRANAALIYTLDLNISIGLSQENISKTLKQIQIELDAIKKNEIDQDIFNFSVHNVIDALKGEDDIMGSKANKDLLLELRGFVSSTEDSIALYRRLTTQDLANFMSTYTLCSTYILENQ